METLTDRLNRLARELVEIAIENESDINMLFTFDKAPVQYKISVELVEEEKSNG